MDLWEFYVRVEALVGDLRETGYASEADQVETAIRGGATSGENLDRLSGALPDVSASVPSLANEADELIEWAQSTLQGH
jgi:hypothetical protein